MARVSEVYGGNWLEKEDIGDRQVMVTIDSVTMHDMPDGKKKAGLHFVGKEKVLLVNVTNATVIEAISGTDEMNDWVGTRICLYTDPNVMFNNRRVGGLRVKAASNGSKPTPSIVKAQPKPAPLPESELDNTSEFDESDDIPF